MVKKEWMAPELESLDVKMTMKFWHDPKPPKWDDCEDDPKQPFDS